MRVVGRGVGRRAVWLMAVVGVVSAVVSVVGGFGASSSSAASAPMFVGLSPARLLETRTGPGLGTVDGEFNGIGQQSAGSTLVLRVVGRGGVAAGAVAVSLNVTVTEAQAGGFVTVFPCGGERPNASNVNYEAGQTVANAVTSRLAADGTVCLFTYAATQLIVDVNGYYPAGSGFGSLSPARLLETRTGPGLGTVDGQFDGIGQRQAGSTLVLAVAGRGGVPADAVAVSLNVTLTETAGGGFVTVFACDGERPNASNVNHGVGETVANGAISRLAADGTVCLFTWAATQLIVDVNGFFPAGSGFGSLSPARLLETRVGPGLGTVDGQFNGIGARPAGSTLTLPVAGRAGVPGGAAAVSLNVTVTEASAGGFVTVFPCGDRPNASNLNYTAGQTVANVVVSTLAADGSICLFTYATTHLIVDINGYYPAAPTPPPPTTTPTTPTTPVTTPTTPTVPAEEWPKLVQLNLDPEGAPVQLGGLVVSRSGRYVIYGSGPTYLRGPDTGDVRELSLDVGVDGAYPIAVSDNGRYVVLGRTVAHRWPSGTYWRYAEYFRYDVFAGTTTRVDIGLGGTDLVYPEPPANVHQTWPNPYVDYQTTLETDISDDGRYVAFTSTADNLVSADTNRTQDVFVRDMANGTTVRASVTDAGGESSLGASHPAISANGATVAYQTSDRQFDASLDATRHQALAFRRSEGVAQLLAKTPSGTPADGDSQISAWVESPLSADGTRVVFQSSATDILEGVGGGLFVRNLDSQSTSLADFGGYFPAAKTDDGRYVAGSRIDDGYDFVFTKDMSTSTETMITPLTVCDCDTSVWISPDGRYVTFINWRDDPDRYYPADLWRWDRGPQT